MQRDEKLIINMLFCYKFLFDTLCFYYFKGEYFYTISQYITIVFIYMFLYLCNVWPISWSYFTKILFPKLLYSNDIDIPNTIIMLVAIYYLHLALFLSLPFLLKQTCELLFQGRDTPVEKHCSIVYSSYVRWHE